MLNAAEQSALAVEQARPFGTARLVTSLTVLSLLSPASGLLLEMIIAWRLGASAAVDAYRAIFPLLTVATQLFFTACLGRVLVPLFSDYRANNAERNGWRLAFSAGAVLTFVCLFFVVTVWFKPSILVDFLAPGLRGLARSDALALTRWIALATLPLLWSGVISAVLQAYKVFWITALSMAFNNISMIALLVFFDRERGWEALAFGNVLGFVAMLAVHLWGLRRVAVLAQMPLRDGVYFGPGEGLRRAQRLAWPAFAAIAIPLIGYVALVRALSQMAPGTLAEFGYAMKPLLLATLWPSALATVIFPTLSDARARGDQVEFSRVALKGIRLSLLMTVPVALFLFVVRRSIVSLLFGRGAVDEATIAEISRYFGFALISPIASTMLGMLSLIASAFQDTKALAAAVVVATAWIVLVLPSGIKLLGPVGAMLTISLSAWVAALWLFIHLQIKFRWANVSNLISYAGQLLLFSAGIALPVLIVHMAFASGRGNFKGAAISEVFLAALGCAGTTPLVARMLRLPEFVDLRNYMAYQWTRATWSRARF